MKHCTRCGIDMPEGLTGKICDDCADVTREHRGSVIRVVEMAGGRYRIASGRRGGRSVAEGKELRARVKSMTETGMSANQIALKLGVSTRTVQRMRVDTSTPGRAVSSDGWRNPLDRTVPSRGLL